MGETCNPSAKGVTEQGGAQDGSHTTTDRYLQECDTLVESSSVLFTTLSLLLLIKSEGKDVHTRMFDLKRKRSEVIWNSHNLSLTFEPLSD